MEMRPEPGNMQTKQKYVSKIYALNCEIVAVTRPRTRYTTDFSHSDSVSKF